MKGQTSDPIASTRGVRGPINPLLFNVVIDERLEALNEDRNKECMRTEGVKITALAFADDIVILADNENRIPLLLIRIEEFLTETQEIVTQ